MPPRSNIAAAAASLLLILSCNEADPQPAQPKTNLELYRQVAGDPPELDAAAEAEAVERMRDVWARHHPVMRTRFLGISTLQNPLDAWVIQEVISEVVPDFVVEAGTYRGGSAAFWALVLENVNPEGRVITVDIEDQRSAAAVALPIWQRKVEFLEGSSTASEIVQEIASRVRGKKVLVILDSLHTKEHIAAELEAYAPLVSVGSYLIVQDTPFGGVEAVQEFLASNPAFVADRERERFRITNTTLGYLERIRSD